MKNKTMPAIDLLLTPSKWLAALLLLVATLACISVIIVAIPLGIKLCLLLIIIFSTIYWVLRDVLYALPWSWRRVEVTNLGELRLTNQQGEVFKPLLHPSTFIHPKLVILNTKAASTKRWFHWPKHPVLVLPSQPEVHRHLRVWLKWWKHEELVNESTSTQPF